MSAPVETHSKRILIGTVMGAIGVRGEVKIQSHSDPEPAIFRYQPWILRDARGMDQHIQAAQAGAGGIDRARNRALVGHIDLHEAPCSRRLGNGFAAFAVQVHGHDQRPHARQRAHKALAHATGPSGDEDAAAGQF